MNIAVYCSARTGLPQEYMADARALGEWIGRNGHNLVYGGLAMGLMEVVATATAAAGGKVIGVVPDSRKEREHHANTVNIMVTTLHERKQTMEENADAFVALDGGFGTLDEVMSALASMSFFNDPKPLHLLSRDGLYEPLRIMMGTMVERGLLSSQVAERVQFHTTVASLLSSL